MRRHHEADKQIRLAVEHIIAAYMYMPFNQVRLALPAVLVNQGQNLQRAAVMGAISDKIIAPHTIAMGWPQSPTLGLPLGNLQSLLTPNALNTVVIHTPAIVSQKRHDAPMPITAISPC